jgi:curli biogenesis system outer membrane secretion channel CsgG
MRIRTLVTVCLLLITSAAFAADKPSLGVSEFKNDVNVNWWSSDVAKDLTALLANELSSTGKFRVVERNKLNAVLDEQDLADSGRIDKKSGAKIGKLTGAQYLVFATVTAFDSQSRRTGGTLSYRGISVGGKKEDAYLAVDLRVVDTTTGEVAFSRTVEARASGMGVTGGYYRGGWGGELAKYENTPTGKAIRGVVIEITDYLACAMVDQDDCMSEYQAKESSRRAKTKKSISLD